MESQNHHFQCEHTLEPFTCTVCSFKSPFLLQFKKHLQIHLKKSLDFHEKTYKCEKCLFVTNSLIFSLKHSLERCIPPKPNYHLHDHSYCKNLYLKIPHPRRYKQAKKYKRCRVSGKKAPPPGQSCDKCEYKCVYPATMKVHQRLKHLSRGERIILWVCDRCDFTCKRPDELEQHKDMVHGGDISWLRCDKCTFKCQLERNLEIHKYNKHTEDANVVWLECDQSEYMAEDQEEGKAQRKVKKRKEAKISCEYMAEDQMKREGKAQRRMKKRKEAKMSKESDAKKKTATRKNFYKCDQCNYKVKSARYMASHQLLKHTRDEEVDWIECDQCDYKCKLKRQIKYHKYSKHTNDEDLEWLICDICQVKCKTLKCMARHMEFIHGGIKPIQEKTILT